MLLFLFLFKVLEDSTKSYYAYVIRGSRYEKTMLHFHNPLLPGQARKLVSLLVWGWDSVGLGRGRFFFFSPGIEGDSNFSQE